MKLERKEILILILILILVFYNIDMINLCKIVEPSLEECVGVNVKSHQKRNDPRNPQYDDNPIKDCSDIYVGWQNENDRLEICSNLYEKVSRLWGGYNDVYQCKYDWDRKYCMRGNECDLPERKRAPADQRKHTWDYIKDLV